MDEKPLIRKIGLSKLFLWPEAERIQTYPEAFANLDRDQQYTREEIATRIFGAIFKKEGANLPVRGSHIGNIFGLEKVKDEKLLIHGINAFRLIGPNQYAPTEETVAIGSVFKQDRSGDGWISLLARQIAAYEVRTRVMLYLLGKGGWRLRFPGVGYFGGQTIRTRIIKDDCDLALFGDDAVAFNRLLQEHNHIALGPYWLSEIETNGFQVEEDFVFERAKDGMPSTNDLNSALKTALYPLKYLRALVDVGGEWVLDGDRLKQVLGAELAGNFIDLEAGETQFMPGEWLARTVSELKDELGFVVVSSLVQRWAEQHGMDLVQAESTFDAWLREEIFYNRVSVIATHPGQPRHGRGLFGDSNQRKVKIELQ